MSSDKISYMVGVISGILVAVASTMLYNKIFDFESKETLQKNIAVLNEQLNSTIEINKNLHKVNQELEQEYKNQLNVQKEYCEKLVKSNKDYNSLTKERNDSVKAIVSKANVKVKGISEKQAKEISKAGILSLHKTYNLYNNKGDTK